MTDDDNSGWNTFSRVFGYSTQILRKWHIKRAWGNKISLWKQTITRRSILDIGSYLRRNIEKNWKKSLDEKKFVDAVLMDLSKAFDSKPHS